MFLAVFTSLAFVWSAAGLSSSAALERDDDKLADKKIICGATLEDDFAEDCVTVVINRSNSRMNKKHDAVKFPGVQIAEIRDLSYTESLDDAIPYTNVEGFQQILELRLKKTGKDEVLKAIRQLEKLDFVESAEPNYYYKLAVESAAVKSAEAVGIEEIKEALETEKVGEPVETEPTADADIPDDSVEPAATPNDSQYSGQYAPGKISLPSAWSITTGSASVKVGVIDTGVASHVDLNANVTTGWDFYNGNSTTTDDPLKHGTHVAGIIGAVGNNSRGVAGVNWTVTIVPLQVHNGATTNENSIDGNAINQAINYAREQKIPIINLSLGGKASSNAFETAMQNYKGLIVCSAGNDGADNDVISHYPACSTLENVISVASTDKNDKLATDSNYGKTSVDLAAPGVAILSTLPGNAYGSMGGTSMAAPQVAGVAALILSKYPQLSAIQVKNAILESVDTVSGLSGKCVTGGRLNAYKALVRAQTMLFEECVGGDFNGDGVPEMAALAPRGSGQTSLYIWNMTNHIPSQMSAETEAWYSTTFYSECTKGKIVSGDFNGDGKQDIAAFYDRGNSVTSLFLWRGTSTGKLSVQQVWNSTTFAGTQIVDRVVSGDFNGDGRDDIAAFYDHGNSQTSLFLWYGGATGSELTYTSAVWTSSSYNGTRITGKVTSGDYNGDGRDDVAVFYDYQNSKTGIFVWRGVTASNGLSILSTLPVWESTTFAASSLTNRVTSGDYNGDGRDDIAVFYNYGNNQTGIFKWNGITGTAGFSLAGSGGTVWSSTTFTATKIDKKIVSYNSVGDSKDEIEYLYGYEPQRLTPSGSGFSWSRIS